MVTIIELFQNKKFQVCIDICRIMLLIFAVLIFIVLLMNINEVKLLNSDVCALCANKTGCFCACPMSMP